MTTKENIIHRFDRLAASRLGWKARNRYYYDEQVRYFRFLVPEGSAVLELGCGTGDLLDALKPKPGIGIDFSAAMLKIARHRYPNLEFRLADIEKLEHWDQTFDFLIMSDVVGHLMDIEETFRNLRRFCRPDSL